MLSNLYSCRCVCRNRKIHRAMSLALWFAGSVLLAWKYLAGEDLPMWYVLCGSWINLRRLRTCRFCLAACLECGGLVTVTLCRRSKSVRWSVLSLIGYLLLFLFHADLTAEALHTVRLIVNVLREFNHMRRCIFVLNPAVSSGLRNLSGFLTKTRAPRQEAKDPVVILRMKCMFVKDLYEI